MKNIYCIKCKKYGKVKNPEISYLFYKTLVISIILLFAESVVVSLTENLKKKNQLKY